MTAHLSSIETRLRLLSAHHLADAVVRQNAPGTAPHLLERFTADWEGVCRRLERETLLLRNAGLGEPEIARVCGERREA